MTHSMFADAHMFFQGHGSSTQPGFSSLSVDPEP